MSATRQSQTHASLSGSRPSSHRHLPRSRRRPPKPGAGRQGVLLRGWCCLHRCVRVAGGHTGAARWTQPAPPLTSPHRPSAFATRRTQPDAAPCSRSASAAVAAASPPPRPLHRRSRPPPPMTRALFASTAKSADPNRDRCVPCTHTRRRRASPYRAPAHPRARLATVSQHGPYARRRTSSCYDVRHLATPPPSLPLSPKRWRVEAPSLTRACGVPRRPERSARFISHRGRWRAVPLRDR